MPNEENPQGFVRTKLPWIAAIGALVIFLVTLNQWVNLRSLPFTARVTGWDWTLPVQNPLLYTLTYPFRFLPAGIQPLALNIFSAICGALALGLLARSVALLPHDRTHEQRIRERSEFSLLSIKLAWIPPVLAVAVCGLQLTYWEHATAFTGEALDLLLFAYVVRSLLEYRISRAESWLSKMALVYGLGVTNNWAMIGFFPLILGALVWIKGVRFFDPGFLLRVTGFGLLGLLFYLLLPMVWMFKSAENFSFFHVLKSNWAAQKMFLADVPVLRNRAMLLGLVSVLPVVLMGIRWPSSFGDTSAAGATLTNAAFRIIHLFFLVACIWVAFDPGYSPRQLGMGLPFLSFYYLAALAIGYYTGYALLVFTDPPRKSWKRENPLNKIINPLIRVAVLAAVAAVPVALAMKNYAPVQAANGKILREFAAHTIAALPEEPAYLLSEDVMQLGLVEAALQSRDSKHPHVIVNTRALETPAYHLQMRKRYGDRWPEVVDVKAMPLRVDTYDIQQLVRGLAANHPVIYLHPSFGYFFDVLYPVPNGPNYRLRMFEPDQVLPPALPAEVLEKNVALWSAPREFLERLEEMNRYDSPDAKYLNHRYSRAINAWGVTLQRANKLDDAGQQFQTAIELNTNNVAARLNEMFNTGLRSGNATNSFNFKADEMLGGYRSWDELLSENGPLDRPEFCFFLGATLLNSAQYRQAALQFARVIDFQPTNFAARIAFTKALVFGGWPAKGLEDLNNLVSAMPSAAREGAAEVAAVRAAAYYGMTNFAQAEATLLAAHQAHPGNSTIRDSILEIYRSSGRLTNALAFLDAEIQRQPTNLVAHLQKADVLLASEQFDRAHATLDYVLTLVPDNSAALLFHAFAYIQEKKFDDAMMRVDRVLQGNPDDLQALLYKGVVLMEQKQFDKARDVFNRVLRKDEANLSALRNRAILNLRADRLSDAKEDYDTLRKLTPKSHAVYYGLGEIAYKEKDLTTAQLYYQTYLRFAPAGGSAELEEERQKVQARLQEIDLARK